MLKLYWRIVFRPYMWHIVLIAAASFLSSVAEVAGIGLIVPIASVILEPELSGDTAIVVALDRAAALIGLSPRPESVVKIGLLVVAVLIILKHGLLLLQQGWVSWLSSSICNTIKARMFKAYLSACFSELARRGRGAIHEDIREVSFSIGASIKTAAAIIYSVVYILVSVVLMFYLSWWVTLVVGGLGLLGVRYLRVALEYRSKTIGQQIHELLQRQSALVMDALDGIQVIKTYAKEATTVARLEALQRPMVSLKVRGGLARRLPATFFEVFGVLLVVTLMSISFNFPNLGLSLPEVLVFVVVMHRLMPAASGVNSGLISLSNLFRRVEIADEVLNKMDRERSWGRPLPASAVETIELKKISFHYNEHAVANVLHNVDLTFQRGQVTALVGPTGAGKTTIADLLVRLYEPVSGRILVDGTDLFDVGLTSWRRHIGYVGQDIFLFNATIYENIAMWDPSIPLAKVEEVGRAAQLDGFVLSLPEGYNTEVGDRGLKLSGGQRQRVSIARALLQEANVLIFDEATSALDNSTEQAVHSAISQMRTESIVILIAHRLSTVKDADQIAVLHEGRVVERGRYEDLLAAGGHFTELYYGSEQPEMEAPSNEEKVVRPISVRST